MLFTAFLPLIVLLVLGNTATAELTAQPAAEDPTDVEGIPAEMLRLYVSAVRTCPGLHWSVPAAVGKVETDHGRSNLPGVKNGTNPAGAAGPMQFLISTWGGATKIRVFAPFTGYAADGDGDGWADVYNRADAVYGAVKYLCALGAADDLRQALHGYNHSWAYVEQVLAIAGSYRQAATTSRTSRSFTPQQQSGADRLTPRTRHMRDLIKRQFAVPHGIGCYRAIEDGGEHPRGRACDFMLSSNGRMPSPGELARGDAIAGWAQANASSLGVLYVIWKQRIWSLERAREGWRPMSDRGTITENHWDHVHISMK
ncbi:lytic transglycosylase domain-containing protein [Nonomuraea ceibae]|uniref:lytic transglycosylase domain-containing protein n=1 Tax=Nonomuraea ceibae TaxID=1935170 RepID=UPI001C5D9BE7|nr:lytic transglycosylase domain-containing protein [Nonomuraea ceibae]